MLLGVALGAWAQGKCVSKIRVADLLIQTQWWWCEAMPHERRRLQNALRSMTLRSGRDLPATRAICFTCELSSNTVLLTRKTDREIWAQVGSHILDFFLDVPFLRSLGFPSAVRKWGTNSNLTDHSATDVGHNNVNASRLQLCDLIEAYAKLRLLLRWLIRGGWRSTRGSPTRTLCCLSNLNS